MSLQCQQWHTCPKHSGITTRHPTHRLCRIREGFVRAEKFTGSSILSHDGAPLLLLAIALRLVRRLNVPIDKLDPAEVLVVAPVLAVDTLLFVAHEDVDALRRELRTVLRDELLRVVAQFPILR